MHNLYLISFIIFTGLPLTACKTTTVIDEHKAVEHINLESSDSIVLLGRRHQRQNETEEDYISCVGKNLAEGGQGLNIIPEQEFIDSMYPYFETSTAPMDVKNLDKLMQNPEVSKKFENYKVQYFIWIDGSTQTVDKDGALTCVGGPAGCFGFAAWSDKAVYEAKIWDLKNSSISGKINTETKGTSYLPAVIIPIPLLASVKSDACDGMATQLKKILN